MKKSAWYSAAPPLYRTGWDTEARIIATLAGKTYEVAYAHLMRIMETANCESTDHPENREFWRGVNDAAWEYYQELRSQRKEVSSDDADGG